MGNKSIYKECFVFSSIWNKETIKIKDRKRTERQHCDIKPLSLVSQFKKQIYIKKYVTVFHYSCLPET